MDDIVKQLHAIYKLTDNTYSSKGTNEIKLSAISKTINESNKVLKDVFNAIIDSDVSTIDLSEMNTVTQLRTLIESESNSLVKVSLIISYLHHVVFDLMGKEEACYSVLKGKNEMNITDDVDYYVYVIAKVEQNPLFYLLSVIFSLESLFMNRFYIGIDFEYTGGKYIKLYQMNYDHKVAKQKFIFILNPLDLEDYMINHFIDMIICNGSIKKILHGTDSLDLPYIYTDLLKNDSDKIIRFTKSMIDTRFFCEYYKLNKGGSGDDARCNIYNDDKRKSGVYNFDLITEAKQNELAEMLYSLPPERMWNLRTMTKTELLYAAYDCLFLKYFYYKIISFAIADETTDEAIKGVTFLYRNVLFELCQFLILESKKITGLVSKCKEDIDPVHNFMVKSNQISHDKQLKMLDVYQSVSQGISLASPRVQIDSLLKVTYFKTPMVILLKKITYSILSNRCKIYQNKMTVYTTRQSTQMIHDHFAEYKFPVLKDMFREIEMAIETRIRKSYC